MFADVMLFWISWFFTAVHADGIHQSSPSADRGAEHALIERLLTGYNKDVRPAKHHSDVITVTLGLALVQIINLDEKNQILTTNCWMNQMWIDPKLAWKPRDFDNITSVLLPIDKLWKPDILLYNAAHADYYHRTISTNGIIHYTGNVTWLVSTIMRTSCAIDVRNYPFDQQNCSMKFASWTYDGSKVDLTITTTEGDLSNYVPSGEWQLINMTSRRSLFSDSSRNAVHPDITISILMRRRPMFYVAMYLTPCGAATCFVLLGFGIPGQCGEKVFLCIKSLLSLVFFLQMLGDFMPPTSASIPLITLCYGSSMLVISLATAVQVWTLNLHYRGERGDHLPPALKRLLVDRIAPLLRVPSTKKDLSEDAKRVSLDGAHGYFNRSAELVAKINGAVKMAEVDPKNYTTQIFGLHLKEFAVRLSTTLNLICSMLDKSKDVLYVGNDVDPIVEEWQTLAMVMDRIMAVVFSVMTVVITISIFSRISYD